MAKTYEHKVNNTLGFYFCFRGIVEKINNVVKENDVYSMDELLEKCGIICTQNGFQKEYVEIMLFVCRGYVDKEEQVEHINVYSPDLMPASIKSDE